MSSLKTSIKSTNSKKVWILVLILPLLFCGCKKIKIEGEFEKEFYTYNLRTQEPIKGVELTYLQPPIGFLEGAFGKPEFSKFTTNENGVAYIRSEGPIELARIHRIDASKSSDNSCEQSHGWVQEKNGRFELGVDYMDVFLLIVQTDSTEFAVDNELQFCISVKRQFNSCNASLEGHRLSLNKTGVFAPTKFSSDTILYLSPKSNDEYVFKNSFVTATELCPSAPKSTKVIPKNGDTTVHFWVPKKN
jgi:hypothetical protein